MPKKESCSILDPRTEFKCPVPTCGEICSSFTELLNHKRIHKGLSIHICEYCNRKFATNYSLKSHKRTHTGEKPYHCPEAACNKKFNTSGDLQKHIRTHTGERPFQCELCGKSFTTSNIRKVHMRTHTGEKPYHCKHEGCSRKFSSATNFQNHSRIHTGEKPYICSFAKCQSRFTEYSSLYKHYLVHSVIKKHVCTICKRQYKQLSSLNLHINAVHINEDLNEVKDPLSEKLKYKAKIWNDYSLSNEVTSDVDEDESPLDVENIRAVGDQNEKIKSSKTVSTGPEAVFVLTSFASDNVSGDTNVLNNDTSCVTKEELEFFDESL